MLLLEQALILMIKYVLKVYFNIAKCFSQNKKKISNIKKINNLTCALIGRNMFIVYEK